MLKYTELTQNASQFLSLTSLTVEEFECLLNDFEYAWQYQMRYFTFEGKPRERKYSEKSTSVLPLIGDKLFFILYYLKNHPLQETLGANFGMSQPQANVCIHRYKHILRESLKFQQCLPARTSTKLKQDLAQSDEEDFYTDGVERAIPRSTDWQTQKENYSGKKKQHTQKNTIFSATNGKVCFLSGTYEGKVHDKKINEAQAVELPRGSRCFQDTGFLGYMPKGEDIQVVMPVKKPKGRDLTEDEKHENTQIARVRVRVEHVIAGVKRLRIVKDKIRPWVDEFRDLAMEIACGLHNFRLMFRPWKYPDADKILQS